MPEYKWDKKKATEKGLRNIQKQAASYDLDRIVRAGKEDQDYKSGTSGAGRVIADMSKKNQDFINRNRRKDGSLNSAALGLLNYYWDDRSDYQRDLNQFIKSGPAAKEAYLDRFPVGGRINLGIPAAFNAAMNVATPIKYFAQTAGDVAGKLVPKGIKEAFGFHKNKFMNDLSNVGPGLKKEFKKLAGLNSTEESLLNTINTEMTSSQKSAQELLQAQNEDWTDAILGDDIKDAENKIMDDAEKELALAKEILFGMNDTSQTTAYDPTEDLMNIDPYSDRAKRLGLSDVWSDSYVPSYPHPSYQTDQTDQTDIFDPSQNRMPHVPITHEQKKRHVEDAMGFEPGFYDDRWAEVFDEDISEKEMSDRYDFVRGKQDKGLEYKPWEGVVSKKNDWGEWQLPGTSEIQDQIRWNTANRPLDWSETPELTEDLIKENITGGTDWGWNKGGYLKKFDDGGYANMSTYEKLKAINDSIAEG